MNTKMHPPNSTWMLAHEITPENYSKTYLHQLPCAFIHIHQYSYRSTQPKVDLQALKLAFKYLFSTVR